MIKSKVFRWVMLIWGVALLLAVALFAARFAILAAIYPELFAYSATSPDGFYADGRGTEDGVVYTYVSAKAGEDGTFPSLHCKAGDLSMSLGEVISPDAIRASGGFSVAGHNGETEWKLVSARGQWLRVSTDRENVVRSIGVTAAGDAPLEIEPKFESVEVTLNGEPLILPLTESQVERLFGDDVKITRRVSP